MEREARGRESKPLAVTIGEAAALLGVGRQRIRTAIREGSLPAHRLGNAYLIPRSAIDAMFPTTERVEV